MKRTKKRVNGPSVRYFQYNAGVVLKKKPALVRIVLPVFVTVFVLAGGSYVGLRQFDQRKPVTLSNQSQFEPVEAETTATSTIDLEPFQAKEDELLADEIKAKLHDMPSGTNWSVSVRDLNSGRMANINADKQMTAASFYKMFLLAPLEKRLSSEYWESYVSNQTISQCVVAMIEVSDNDCPRYLSWYMGRTSVDTVNQELGFKKTTVGFEEGNMTTSRDMSELMYRLQNSMLLSDKARRLVFDGLYDQKYRDGIPAGCGEECLVGNKTGDLEGIKHDAAVVKHGQAHYIVVIMSSGNGSWEQIADIAKAVDTAMLP